MYNITIKAGIIKVSISVYHFELDYSGYQKNLLQ